MGTLRSKVGLPEASVQGICSSVGLWDLPLSESWFSCEGPSAGVVSAACASPSLWESTMMLSPGERLFPRDVLEVEVLSSNSESRFYRRDW